MPYEIKENYKDCSGFSVVKEDDGKVMGCHTLKEDAEQQLKALYASEVDEAKENSVRKFGDSVAVYIPWDAFSFADIMEYKRAQERKERVEEVIRYYQALATNILYATEEQIPDKEAALNTLTAELKAELSKADELKEKFSFGAIVKNVLNLSEKKEEPETASNSFMVWKEGDRYHWLAVWTNKYRDDDRPSEILASEAHREFIKAVYSGEEPFPELWHFHVRGTRWGQSEWLHYDEETGFMLAAGLVDIGKENEAEAIAALDIPIGVSHGMPAKSIVRDRDDHSIITRYVTREISDLPADRAANKLTAFQVLKEAVMAIPEEKRSYLRVVGLKDDKIDAIEDSLKAAANKAEELGLESKESEETPEEGEAQAVAENSDEPVEAADASPVTREEIAEGIGEAVAPVAEAVSKLAELFEAQQKQLSDLVAQDDEKIAKKAADTPAASIAALISRNMRAIGDERAKVSRGDNFDAPVEAEDKARKTGIGFIDELISDKKQADA